MNLRPIGSTPNRQHTTNLNHVWQGTIGNTANRITRPERIIFTSQQKKFMQGIRRYCIGDTEAVIKLAREGKFPVIKQLSEGRFLFDFKINLE